MSISKFFILKMFPTSQKTSFQALCPSLRYDTICPLPNCIFQHTPTASMASAAKAKKIHHIDTIETVIKKGIEKLNPPIAKNPKSPPNKSTKTITKKKSIEKLIPLFSNKPTSPPNTIVKKRSIEKLDPRVGNNPLKKSKISPKPTKDRILITKQTFTHSHTPRISKPIEKENKQTYKNTSLINGLINGLSSSFGVKNAQPQAPKPIGNDKDKKKVSLMPKPLQISPAPLSTRTKFLELLYSALEKQNHPKAAPIAIKQESEVAAKSSKFTYSNEMKQLIVRAKAGKFTVGLEVSSGAYVPKKLSSDEMYQALVKRLIPIELLSKNKYITIIPEPVDAESTQNCKRCNVPFDINDKREQKCTFHWGKKERAVSNDKLSLRYSCCSEPIGQSSGCMSIPHHTYADKTPNVLQAAIAFKPSVDYTTSQTLAAAGVDCEMSYTSLGMELVRVTIVNFEDNKIVLDRVVKPIGELWDANTKFSGITAEDISHGIVSETGETVPSIDFETSRVAISKFVNKDTILIGHGLENDLNAMRLIHHKVVDTSILYPVFNPTYKSSLKDLTFKYLSRAIQGGEHDSAEDAIASMDIVKHNIELDANRKK